MLKQHQCEHAAPVIGRGTYRIKIKMTDTKISTGMKEEGRKNKLNS